MKLLFLNITKLKVVFPIQRPNNYIYIYYPKILSTKHARYIKKKDDLFLKRKWVLCTSHSNKSDQMKFLFIKILIYIFD